MGMLPFGSSSMCQVMVFLLFAAVGAQGPFECPGHDDGWLYPDLDNCQCFWDCANGSPFYRCCGPGTLFDDVNHNNNIYTNNLNYTYPRSNYNSNNYNFNNY